MSVLVHKRTENKLEAYQKTATLARYTMQMCGSEAVFPKKTRWTTCNRIIDTCTDCLINIRRANKIQPKTREDAAKRLSYQQDALLDFDSLYCLMTISYETYGISSHRMDVWSQMMLDAEETTQHWHDSDRRRYSAQFES